MKPKSIPLVYKFLILGFASLLAGCATSGRHLTAWDEITLAPGDTGICQSNPCRVFFQMPPGDGKYRVMANQVGIGEYPAGKKVLLGSFYDSSSIRVLGTDAPIAYIHFLVAATTSD